MKKEAVMVLILLLTLAACGSKTTGKRVDVPDTSNTGIAVANTEVSNVLERADEEEKPEKSAAEVLRELQSSGELETESSEKSGTFYPPVQVKGTGQEALKEKTRALFSKEVYSPNVDADDSSGAKYHDSDGDPANLPDNYGSETEYD